MGLRYLLVFVQRRSGIVATIHLRWDVVMCGPFAALFSDFKFNERNIFSERKQFMPVTERLAVEAPFASVG